MSEDRRVYMYKGREARLFNSIDEVPEGEGWQDAPYDLEAVSETDKPKRRKKAEADPVEETPDGDGN